MARAALSGSVGNWPVSQPGSKLPRLPSPSRRTQMATRSGKRLAVCHRLGLTTYEEMTNAEMG
jgi:hypothetical protein